NPVDFTTLEGEAPLGALLLENRVMQYYVKLNQEGRDKVLGIMEDYVQVEKYKSKTKKAK
ncbi:MAG: transcriptional regulator, partial [Lachnospiraceae bacterium]|nr:transcriptional regulator [Lachnospiraceae bacterium]